MAPYGAPTLSLLLAMTPAMRAMSLWILILFSLLTLAHGAPAKREYDPNEKYYMHGDIRCLRCLPGKHVLRHCSAQDTESTCAPCIPGHTYSEYLTGQTECLSCTVCRADQEEESPCTVDRNTVCKCKKGTYCPPGEYCEICQRCKTSCPPGEVIRTPCNSTSDAECGPPETESNIVTIVVSVFLVLGVFLAVGCIWFFFCQKKYDKSRLIPKITDKLTVSFKCEEPTTGDAETPFLSQGTKLRFKDNITENEKNEAINKTFNIFVELVPPGGPFDKFVRYLGLNNNDIERAKQDNPQDAYNKCYTMLLLLHGNNKFDVNIWLQTLQDLKMKKVAQDIVKKLTKDGLFEESSQE